MDEWVHYCSGNTAEFFPPNFQTAQLLTDVTMQDEQLQPCSAKARDGLDRFSSLQATWRTERAF